MGYCWFELLHFSTVNPPSLFPSVSGHETDWRAGKYRPLLVGGFKHEFSFPFHITLWLFNVAMEHGP